MSKITYPSDVEENIYAAFQEHLESGHFFRAKQCIAEMKDFDEFRSRTMEWELKGELTKNL